MHKCLKLATQAGVVIVVMAIGASVLGRAQTSAPRRGAPHDWSHSHLIANRFGLDGDKAISSDWRVYNKHVRRSLAQSAVAQAATMDWSSLAMRKVKQAWKP